MTGQETLAKPRRFTLGGLAILAAILAVAGLLIGGGVKYLMQRESGDRVQAKVSECFRTGSGRTRGVHCNGSWVTGGRLLDGGTVHVGTVDGAGYGDVGKTITVTVSKSGDTAYTRSLTKPLGLIGLGLLPLILAIVLFRGMLRGRTPKPPVTQPAAPPAA